MHLVGMQPSDDKEYEEDGIKSAVALNKYLDKNYITSVHRPPLGQRCSTGLDGIFPSLLYFGKTLI